MKRIILLSIILFCVKLTAPPINEVKLFVTPIQPYERLWEAMCFVESSFNPLAVNEAEQAYGLVQIRQIKLDWYFDKTGKLYTLQDCFNESVAKEIWNYHMSLYPNAETGARAWNGRYDLTYDYWNKVQNYLNYNNENRIIQEGVYTQRKGLTERSGILFCKLDSRTRTQYYNGSCIL